MRSVVWIIGLIVLVSACRKPFEAPENPDAGTILVVEGGLAVGDSADNKIFLSRLQPLDDTVVSRRESGATISVISKTGASWVIPEVAVGEYRALNNIPAANDHKLRIVTKSGRKYETPFLKTVNTPPIDSVTWQEQQNVDIFVHTHDPTNATPYYRWDFTETWEYRSWYESFAYFKDGQLIDRKPDEMVYQCWRTRQSGNVILANTLALTENRISFQPLISIVRPEERLSVRYSILVRQYGLTKEAYEFWNILRKNTELTGSLFDPQPSQLPGNIICLDDPNERVIGFVSAGKQVSKRIFIRNGDLRTSWPKEDQALFCVALTGTTDEMIVALKQDTTLAPAYFITGGGLAIAKKRCTDCTLNGGVNVKPGFW
jgi:hypothetical protein